MEFNWSINVTNCNPFKMEKLHRVYFLLSLLSLKSTEPGLSLPTLIFFCIFIKINEGKDKTHAMVISNPKYYIANFPLY